MMPAHHLSYFIWQVIVIASINYHHKSTMIQDSAVYYALRAEIDSLFAVQVVEPIRTIAGMENQYFYFIVALVFALLGTVIFGGLVFYKSILSFKKDLKELARMKGDFVQLATLIKAQMAGRQRNSEDIGMRAFNPTDTQVLVDAKELRTLRALKQVYQENTAIPEKRTKLIDDGDS